MITRDELLKIQLDGKVVTDKMFTELANDMESYIDEKLKKHYKNGTSDDCHVRMERFKAVFNQICADNKIRFDETMYLECIFKVLDRYKENGIKYQTYTSGNESYCQFRI